MANKLVILSGGLDSAIMIHQLHSELCDEELHAITFNYGQRHNIECIKAAQICTELNITHKIVDISFLGDMVSSVSSLSANSGIDIPKITEVLGVPQTSSYVPSRNLIFISLALSYAESNDITDIYLGIQSNDLFQYHDCSKSFVDNLQNIANLNRLHPITIHAPLLYKTKLDSILWGIGNGIDFSKFVTCYNAKEVDGVVVSCGKCATCSDRISHFIQANYKDPAVYAHPVDWDKLIEPMVFTYDLERMKKAVAAESHVVTAADFT
jgi:7-cyano-7-deazaguanine synthase